MNRILPPLSFGLVALLVQAALAQQPLREYIESTSPVRGGGVVTTIQYSEPVYRTPAGALNTVTASGTTIRPGDTVLRVPNYPYVRPAVPTSYQQPMVNVTPPVQQVQGVQQIPSLGTPTNWRYALRADCCNVANTRPALAAPLPAATPTYAAPQVGAYRPLIQLNNMPPNVYAGQGIIGQPTLYVDGQPVRNFLRYISP